MSYKQLSFVRLKDISVGKGQYGIAASAVEYSKSLPTYLRITDITEDGKIKNDDLKSVADEKASNYFLEENDIVFARTGASTGRAYFHEKKNGKFVYAGYLIKFTLDEKLLNPKYMKYFILSNEYKNWVKSHIGGSTRGNINAKTFGELEIPLPSREQQNSLVKILSSLDDKIDLNNKINQRLEELAQTIYKRWFVDFEFPDENGEPYKSSGGEMVESELGIIPKEFKVTNLGVVCDFDRGLSYKGKHLTDKGVPMINLGNIKPGGQYREDKLKYYDGEYKERHIVKPFDIVLANTDMTQNRDILGSSIFVPNLTSEDIIYSHHLYALKNIKISKYYLYYLTKSSKFRDMCKMNANGTTVLSISKKDFENVHILIPNKSTIEKFTENAKTIVKSIHKNRHENRRLKDIRDTLLPKLMNGEIEVPIEE